MKIVFMGTPDLAAVSLRSLIDAGHEILAVVTQPDKPNGRGNKVTYSAVKELAVEENLPVLQPVRVKEESFIEQIREIAPEAIVVAAFGQILPKTLLEIPPYGCINVHASLLPKYRGAAPIQWVILNGEKEAGVTIMHMDVGCDTGDMILSEKITLDPKETGGSLHDKLAKLGGELIVKVLPMIEAGTAPRTKQVEEESTYVSILKKEDGHISFAKSAESIERLVRGLNPWPSAFTKMDGKMLKIWEADVINGPRKGADGEVINVTKDSFIVQTGEGYLAVKELQLEGKKRMTAESFLRGSKIETGIILG